MSGISDFFKREALGLSYWIWAVIALALLCILIVVIIVCVKRKKGEKTESSDAVLMIADAQPKDNGQEEQAAPEPVKEEKAEEQKAAVEEKKENTAAKKTTATKTTAKPAAQKSESDAVTKVYHISKRKEDKKWQVKAEGADKALRLFFTQSEAIEYAKKVAGNQSGRIVVHKEGGGFRKINY